jgi:hypothetical protein
LDFGSDTNYDEQHPAESTTARPGSPDDFAASSPPLAGKGCLAE